MKKQGAEIHADGQPEANLAGRSGGYSVGAKT